LKQKQKPLQENKEQLRELAAKVDPTDYLKLQRRSLQKKARYSQNSKDQVKTAGVTDVECIVEEKLKK
jgi:hypothetical protein